MKKILITVFCLLLSLNLWADNNESKIDTLIKSGKYAAIFQKYSEAEKFYLEAYQLNSAIAAYLIATHYVNGYGRDIDINEAIAWYEKASKLGHARAFYELGVMYHKYKNKPNQAQQYFEKAIQLGDIDAFHDLAIIHLNKQQYAKAYKLLTDSKIATHAPSQYTLAQFYLFAIYVDKDAAQAINLLDQAAAKNYLPAIVQLGKIYASGQFVAKDLEQAESLFAKGYKFDKKNGLDLAWILMEQNKTSQAKELLQTMAQEGNEEAKSMLKNL